MAKVPTRPTGFAFEPSLHETLHDSLRLYPHDDRDRAVAQLIIEALDDDGYLRQDLQELVGARGYRAGIDRSRIADIALKPCAIARQARSGRA